MLVFLHFTQKLQKYLYIMDGDTIHMNNKCIICKCELEKDIYIICEECYEKYISQLESNNNYSKREGAYVAD